MPDDIVAETDQLLVMNNERFAVPELVFRPDDIGTQASPISIFYPLLILRVSISSWFLFLGIDQAGLSFTIAHSISLLPTDLQGMFWANIGLIGGNTKFSGFRDRL